MLSAAEVTGLLALPPSPLVDGGAGWDEPAPPQLNQKIRIEYGANGLTVPLPAWGGVGGGRRG